MISGSCPRAGTYSPWAFPSKVPRPVMAMRLTPRALTNAGTPDGQSTLLLLMTTVAPASSRSSTLSFIHKGAVT